MYATFRANKNSLMSQHKFCEPGSDFAHRISGPSGRISHLAPGSWLLEVTRLEFCLVQLTLSVAVEGIKFWMIVGFVPRDPCEKEWEEKEAIQPRQ